MRAIVLNGVGGTDVLELADVADPEPGPEEILVDVVATALNRADLIQRRGFYPDPDRQRLLAALERTPGVAPPPEILGMEFAGRVAALGRRATAWQVGDEVMGIVAGGAYAERLCVHERQAIAVPAGVAVADAAAIPEVFITAFDALVLQGGLGSGGWALVHAGASGVGTAAIQIAGAVGARVAVTTSTGKVDACRSLGADLVVDYKVDDFVAAVATAVPGGVDVVLDVIGGDYLDRNLDVIRVGATIVQVGVMGGGRTEVTLGKFLPKRAHLVGTVLRGRPLEEKIAVSQRFAAAMGPRFADGTLRPVIDQRFALEQVAAAHERMEANENVGKLVLDIQP
ncbi:MAG TPA: NAD(P)H-quinone oxidoreductase [Acidimicrobiales bacterium]|nr:NAD(P)H-quinone oxidoreductase [Acidimicrobiales bacterium]